MAECSCSTLLPFFETCNSIFSVFMLYIAEVKQELNDTNRFIPPMNQAMLNE